MNVSMVVKHQELMNSSKKFLWTLLLCNKRNDQISLATKAIVLSWWSLKTKMSPNHIELVKNQLTPHVYDTQLTQYLLETQVFFCKLDESRANTDS
jgi:hypothetical protein